MFKVSVVEKGAEGETNKGQTAERFDDKNPPVSS